MSNKNEVFEYLIDQLRQQVNNNQCEDRAQEVQSLKNQLRDMSELVDELQKELAIATGDVEAYKFICSGGGISGDPTPSEPPTGYINCGVAKPEECEHEWQFYGVGFPCMCLKCGLKK